MSVYSCAQLRDVAPELALGVLGGAERAEAIMHVNGCARCQALVNELTEAADALPLLAPEIEPPVGFEQRVLSSGRARRRRSVRRLVVGRRRRRGRGRDPEHHDRPSGRVRERRQRVRARRLRSSASKPTAVKMVSASDLPAGWAYVTNKHSVAIAVDYGVQGGHATTSRYNRAAGSTVTIGTMADRRTITARGPARVRVALRAGSTISLVDANGTPSCHGTIAQAA